MAYNQFEAWLYDNDVIGGIASIATREALLAYYILNKDSLGYIKGNANQILESFQNMARAFCEIVCYNLLADYKIVSNLLTNLGKIAEDIHQDLNESSDIVSRFFNNDPNIGPKSNHSYERIEALGVLAGTEENEEIIKRYPNLKKEFEKRLKKLEYESESDSDFSL